MMDWKIISILVILSVMTLSIIPTGYTANIETGSPNKITKINTKEIPTTYVNLTVKKGQIFRISHHLTIGEILKHYRWTYKYNKHYLVRQIFRGLKNCNFKGIKKGNTTLTVIKGRHYRLKHYYMQKLVYNITII